MVSQELRSVKRAAHKAALSRERLEHKIREAHAAGESSRKIAGAAGVSHTQVQRILRADS